MASRDGDRARQFAADLDLENSFASYQDLLECDRVDAVYIALPNSMHTEWAVKALKAESTPCARSRANSGAARWCSALRDEV